MIFILPYTFHFISQRKSTAIPQGRRAIRVYLCHQSSDFADAILVWIESEAPFFEILLAKKIPVDLTIFEIRAGVKISLVLGVFLVWSEPRSSRPSSRLCAPAVCAME